MDNLHRSKETIEFNEVVKKTLEDAYISSNELKKTPVTDTDYKEKIEKFNQSKNKIRTLIKQAKSNFDQFEKKSSSIKSVNKEKKERNRKKKEEQFQNFDKLKTCLITLVNLELSTLENEHKKRAENLSESLKDFNEVTTPFNNSVSAKGKAPTADNQPKTSSETPTLSGSKAVEANTLIARPEMVLPAKIDTIVKESKEAIKNDNCQKLNFLVNVFEYVMDTLNKSINYYEEKYSTLTIDSEKESNQNEKITQKNNLAKLTDGLKNIKSKLSFLPKQEVTQVKELTSKAINFHPSKDSEKLNENVDFLVQRVQNCSEINFDYLKNEIQKGLIKVVNKKEYYVKKSLNKGFTVPTIEKWNKQNSNFEKLSTALQELVHKFEPPSIPAIKETFFNTSGSEKYAKTHKNQLGAHVLGFFEAIGRAILTPFIAITLAFKKDPVNYEEKITTYFETIKHSITFEK